MSRGTYSKYPNWKPSGSNDYTSTYLRRAELILNNKDKKEEKKCSCGCSGGKDCNQSSSKKTVIIEERPSDLILIPKQPTKEMILVETNNTRPKPPARSKSCYYINRPCRKPVTPPPSQRVIIETTIEHAPVYTRPVTAAYHYSMPIPDYYTERVYYPRETRGYYYCEPVEYVTNVYEY